MHWTVIFRKMVFLLSFGVFIACSGDKLSKTELAKEKEVIKQVLLDMWKAIEHKDLEAYQAFIHSDYTQFNEIESQLQKGKVLEMEMAKKWASGKNLLHTEMKYPEIEIRGNVAWMTYYWSDSHITPQGAFATKGKSTRIFVKEEDKWLCIHSHFTLIPNS